MQISTKDWKNYIERLSSLDQKAGQMMTEWIQKNGFSDTDALIDFAYAVATKYGEGSAALAAEMYDALAEVSGKMYEVAEVAPTPTRNEVAKTVNGTLKWSKNPSSVSNSVSRLVKRTGADTMLNNARRDGAQFAWVPNGDTCAFCITLASRGWQYMSDKAMKNGHAEHIHANCDCTYAVRFDNKSGVKGYDPQKYADMYYGAEGNTPDEKINAIRRMKYQQNKDRINAQKRAAYAERTKLVSPMRTDLKNEFVLKSVGARGENYDIMDLVTGEIYHLAEGTYLQNKTVFAGKGSKNPYRNAYKFVEKYGGKEEDWQHVKAIGTISTPDGDVRADIHWSQCEGIGKQEMFIKEYLE